MPVRSVLGFLEFAACQQGAQHITVHNMPSAWQNIECRDRR